MRKPYTVEQMISRQARLYANRNRFMAVSSTFAAPTERMLDMDRAKLQRFDRLQAVLVRLEVDTTITLEQLAA